MPPPLGREGRLHGGDAGNARVAALYSRAVKRAVTLLFLLAACSAKTPVVGPTVSPSATPSVSPTGTARRIPAAQQAVFALNGSIYTYDVRTNAVAEVARGQSVRMPRWVSATQISFIQGTPRSANALRIVDLKSRTVSDVLTVDTGIDVYGWSPDRQTIAFITTDRYSYPHLRFYQVDANVGQSVATLARLGGREPGAADQTRIAFSSDGSEVLVVYTYADGDPGAPVGDDASQFQIRAVDGSLSYSVDQKREPTMGTWSADGRTVYYLTGTGLRAWKQGSDRSTPVPGGVNWFDPWPSPDGRLVAFDTGATGTSVKVRTIDVRTGAKKDITKAGFFRPVFASANVVWVQAAVKCSGDCQTPVVAAPQVFAVDIRNGKQTKLALTTLEDIDLRYV